MTGGKHLKFRLDVKPLGLATVEHIHSEQDEFFEILEGSMEILVAGERRMLYAGDVAMVPKGVPHQWWNISREQDLSFNVTFTPALNTEAMFEQAWGLVKIGKCKPDGGPRLVDALMMMNEYHVYLAGAPVWLQKGISAIVGAIAPLFGFRKYYPEFSSAPARNTPEVMGDLVRTASMVIAFLVSFAISTFAQIQWVDQVYNYSSEYQPSNDACTNGWAACNIIGPPNVPGGTGDHGNAWSPSTSSTQREFIVVGFADPISIDAIHIHETFFPGAVDTVYVRNQYTAQWEMVWYGTASYYTDGTSRINTITFPMTNYPVDLVRIAMNSPAVAGYNQIDAISIGGSTVGMKETEQLEAMIYPNPSDGHFSVSMPEQQITKVTVRDVAGRLLREITSTASTLLQIDMQLPKGVYLLEVIGERGTAVTRHVIE